MNRAWLASVVLLVGGVANAAPPTRAAPSRPAPVAPQRPASAQPRTPTPAPQPRPPTPAPPPPPTRAVPPPAPDGPGTAPPLGPADNRRIIGVLEVRVDGVPDEIKERFQHDLEDQVDIKHYWLASRAYVKQRMMRSTKWTEGCIVGACLAEVRAQTGAELVLLAALTGSGTSFGYVVTLVRTDTGRVLQQEADRCDVCTVNEAMTQATLATTNLLNNAPDKLPDEAAEQAARLDLAVGKVQRELAAHDRHTARVGAVLTGVGLAIAAGGLAVYLLQDQPSYAGITAIGGGALAAGGLVVLTF